MSFPRLRSFRLLLQWIGYYALNFYLSPFRYVNDQDIWSFHGTLKILYVFFILFFNFCLNHFNKYLSSSSNILSSACRLQLRLPTQFLNWFIELFISNISDWFFFEISISLLNFSLMFSIVLLVLFNCLSGFLEISRNNSFEFSIRYFTLVPVESLTRVLWMDFRRCCITLFFILLVFLC